MLTSNPINVQMFPIAGRDLLSSFRIHAAHDLRTEINEHKSIEYCTPSDRVEAGIIEQFPSRAAQNDRVSHAACGTPPRSAERNSHGRNNFALSKRKLAQAKLKNPRAPNHFAPRLMQPHAQNPRYHRPVLRKILGESCAQCAPSRRNKRIRWARLIPQVP
jgi:hypothetical protein